MVSWARRARRLWQVGVVGLGLILGAGWVGVAGASGGNGLPVHGILLELAPEPSTEQAQHQGRKKPLPEPARQRLADVFKGKSLPMGLSRELGGGTQLVQWSRPLTAQEAETLIQQLEADPRVLWATPNVFEQLQQVVPEDPLFGTAPNRQWWLAAAPPSSGSIAQLNGGVPDISTAWTQRTGSDVPIAVLDTGLLIGHRDLSYQSDFLQLLPPNRFAYGYDFATNEVPVGQDALQGTSADGDGRDRDFSDPGDGVNAQQNKDLCGFDDGDVPSSWHGTKIAGILAAQTNNRVGVAGINGDARIVSVRVGVRCGALVHNILDAMRWAAGLPVPGIPSNPLPARIINLSFGSRSDCTRDYQNVIDELTARGVLIIAAAGNDDNVRDRTATGKVSRPASCRGVMAVGAVARDGYKTTYSSLGAEIDLMTVGGEVGDLWRGGEVPSDEGILTTSDSGRFEPLDDSIYEGAFGTSFSAPIVAGVASLMLGENPNLTLDQLAHGLKATTRLHVSGDAPVCQAGRANGRCACTTETCGTGLLDAPAALAYARNPDPSIYGEPPAFALSVGGTPASAPAPVSGGGGGGGAWGAPWLLLWALGLAAATRRLRPVPSA